MDLCVSSTLSSSRPRFLAPGIVVATDHRIALGLKGACFYRGFSEHM